MSAHVLISGKFLFLFYSIWDPALVMMMLTFSAGPEHSRHIFTDITRGIFLNPNHLGLVIWTQEVNQEGNSSSIEIFTTEEFVPSLSHGLSLNPLVCCVPTIPLHPIHFLFSELLHYFPRNTTWYILTLFTSVIKEYWNKISEYNLVNPTSFFFFFLVLERCLLCKCAWACFSFCQRCERKFSRSVEWTFVVSREESYGDSGPCEEYSPQKMILKSVDTQHSCCN